MTYESLRCVCISQFCKRAVKTRSGATIQEWEGNKELLFLIRAASNFTCTYFYHWTIRFHRSQTRTHPIRDSMFSWKIERMRCKLRCIAVRTKAPQVYRVLRKINEAKLRDMSQNCRWLADCQCFYRSRWLAALGQEFFEQGPFLLHHTVQLRLSFTCTSDCRRCARDKAAREICHPPAPHLFMTAFLGSTSNASESPRAFVWGVRVRL